MNISFARTLIAVTALTSIGMSMTTPAFATTQGQSNRNLWHVRQRLEADIDMLQHDQRDYGGHRVTALNDLQAARNELLAAEQVAHHDGDHDGDDRRVGVTNETVPADEPGERGQVGSDINLRHVRRSVSRLLSQLRHDANDYGGHKAAAMTDMQSAREELTDAEKFAKAHGY